MFQMLSGCVEDGGCSWLTQQCLSLVLWLLHTMVTLVLQLSSQARGLLLHLQHLAGGRGVEVGLTVDTVYGGGVLCVVTNSTIRHRILSLSKTLFLDASVISCNAKLQQ